MACESGTPRPPGVGPRGLRSYARLERDLVVIGNNNKVEIWSSELWDANQAEQDELFANRDEEVIPGIF